MADVKLTGVKPEDLDRKLFFVLSELRTKAMDASLRAQAKVVIDDARRRVRRSKTRKTGKHLRSAIGVKLMQYRGGLIRVAIVGARTNDPWRGFHAHLIEDGHKVRPQKKTAGKRKSEAKKQFVDARPFMLPAVHATQKQQETAFLTELEKWMVSASK